MDSSGSKNSERKSSSRSCSLVESHISTLLNQLQNQNKDILNRATQIQQMVGDLKQDLFTPSDLQKLEETDNHEKEPIDEGKNELRNIVNKSHEIKTDSRDKFQKKMDSIISMMKDAKQEFTQLYEELNSQSNKQSKDPALIKTEYETKILELQQELESVRAMNAQLLKSNEELKSKEKSCKNLLKKANKDMAKLSKNVEELRAQVGNKTNKQCESSQEPVTQTSSVKRQLKEDEELNKAVRPKRKCTLKNAFNNVAIKLEKDGDPILLSSDCDSDSTTPEEGMENECVDSTTKKKFYADKISSILSEKGPKQYPKEEPVDPLDVSQNKHLKKKKAEISGSKNPAEIEFNNKVLALKKEMLAKTPKLPDDKKCAACGEDFESLQMYMCHLELCADFSLSP